MVSSILVRVLLFLEIILLFLRIFWIPILLILISAVIARIKGQSFMAWWLYGTALPFMAFPHVLLLLFGVIKPVEELDEEIGFLTRLRSGVRWRFSCIAYGSAFLFLLYATTLKTDQYFQAVANL
jgi:hypothetical protein